MIQNMGRNKVDVCQLVQNSDRRTITYSKRKRGLIKKAIELSTMCDQYVSLTLFDKKKSKIVQYCSSYDFNPKLVTSLLDNSVLPQLTYQLFNNNDYAKFNSNKKSKQKNSNNNQVDIDSDEENDINQESIVPGKKEEMI